MDETPTKRISSESGNFSDRITDVSDNEAGEISELEHSSTQNFAQSIRHPHPTTPGDVTSVNEGKSMCSSNLFKSAQNMNRTDASEYHAVHGSSRRRLSFDEMGSAFKPSDDSYRENEISLSDSFEISECDSSSDSSAMESLGNKITLTHNEQSHSSLLDYFDETSDDLSCLRLTSPKMNPGNSQTSTQVSKKATKIINKEKILRHFCDNMRSSDQDSRPEKDKPFGTTDNPVEECFPDAGSTSNSEHQKGIANSYKSFTYPEKNKPLYKTDDLDEEYFPVAGSSSECQKDTANVYKSFSQNDYPKDLRKGSLSTFDAMDYRQVDTIQETKRSSQSGNSSNANLSYSTVSYKCRAKKTEIPKQPPKRPFSEILSGNEHMNASTSHQMPLKDERVIKTKCESTKNSHINKPSFHKRTRRSSISDLRETKVSKLKTFRRSSVDKSQSFPDLQVDPMLTEEGESVDKPREQYRGKRKVSFAKDDPLHKSKEKLFKSL